MQHVHLLLLPPLLVFLLPFLPPLLLLLLLLFLLLLLSHLLLSPFQLLLLGFAKIGANPQRQVQRPARGDAESASR